jgi:iron uptake system EfeUOB component EfeO/EfeM
MNLKLVLLTFLLSNFIFAQRIISQEQYEGKIENSEIILYLKIAESGCPNVYAEGIYRYKSNKSKEWILLKIVFSEQKNQFTLVEHSNTGILILKRGNAKFDGIWISPDGKKQIKVELKKVKVTPKQLEQLEKNLEQENYEANDC